MCVVVRKKNDRTRRKIDFFLAEKKERKRSRKRDSGFLDFLCHFSIFSLHGHVREKRSGTMVWWYTFGGKRKKKKSKAKMMRRGKEEKAFYTYFTTMVWSIHSFFWFFLTLT